MVHLVWAYLQWRLAQANDRQVRNAADVIRLHRDEHAQDWLRGACLDAIATGDLDSVLHRYLRQQA